ncbi:MAG: glucosaminidase domain-containing protein [Bacteroidales bacterium]
MRSKALYIGFIIVIVIVMSACRTTKMAVEVTPENHAVKEYIERYAGIAVSEMNRTGVPASIKLAQGMIESDHGRSRLARVANNHFGIKCHSDWRGPGIYHDDDRRNECFRKYNSPEQSFLDHSDFLVNGSRYKSLFSLKTTDYKGWARGLQKAGYATNPAYANMLIRKIEENMLYNFDTGRALSVPVVSAPVDAGTTPTRSTPVSGATTIRGSRYAPAAAARVMVRNRVEYIIVNETDSFESLTRDFDLLSWELERYNEVAVDSLLVPGRTLFLQPKRKKAEPGIRYHVVREGETMHQVSQLYAIKLQNLYRMNFMEEGSDPDPGRRLNLR